MTLRKMNALLMFVAALYVSGCASTPQCTSTVKNASYTGVYKGVDNKLDPRDLSRDIFCADQFRATKYPNGFVTIFGSSRIKEKNSLPDTSAAQANDEIYRATMEFAEKWTRKHGKQYPIMTGAGPGLMEAGSRGAMAAGGPSIGYTTYYDPEPRGDAADAFWKYNNVHDVITDGLIFSSVSIREFAMILHSSAIIIAPGGTGAEWEIFQILETVKSGQLKKVPIYFIGEKEKHWKSFYARLDDMIRRGTINKDEVTAHFNHVEKIDELTGILERDLINQ